MARLRHDSVTYPEAVPASLYRREILLKFSGSDYQAFLATHGHLLRPRVARALELARLSPGLRVLDLGCGRGETSAHMVQAGCTVYAMDYAPDCLVLTRESVRAMQSAAGQVCLLQGDATTLPLADGSIDRILWLDVLEHLWPWQVEQTLAEVGRVLAPGGYMVVHTLPNRWALQVGYRVAQWCWPHLPGVPRSDYEQAVHVNEQDPLSLRRVLRLPGLASRVWLEAWTARQAMWQAGRHFPDNLRENAYPLLRHPVIARVLALLVRTPVQAIMANDLFALVWRKADAAPSVPVARRADEMFFDLLAGRCI
ncbi:MAG: class I SAM-dependent methyltransferase [Chloroflexi bacterium]|nr:class I SAM-dependent methyltransferase [Chloroflexota bacterium]